MGLEHIKTPLLLGIIGSLKPLLAKQQNNYVFIKPGIDLVWLGYF